jgi:hypothetical protein
MPPEDQPCLDHIVIEDGTPVDGIFSERQMRLLVEVLYSSWAGPGEGRTFVALANVGLFFSPEQPPLVPDVMLSLDVQPSDDLRQKKNSSYFIWVLGKPPDVVIEVVSNKQGGEAGHKLKSTRGWGFLTTSFMIPMTCWLADGCRFIACMPELITARRRAGWPTSEDLARHLRRPGSGLAALVRHGRQLDSNRCRAGERPGRKITPARG